MDFNGLVSEAQKALVTKIVDTIMADIALPTALAFLAGPLKALLAWIVGYIVVKGDLVLYTLGNNWMNSHDGKTFEEAANALQSLPPSATPDQVKAAQQAKMDAFDRLMDAP